MTPWNRACFIGLLAAILAAAEPVAVVVGGQAPALERYAAEQLCAYLDKLFAIRTQPVTAVPDHVPELEGDTGLRRAGTAYCIAYMRALLRRANQEVG